VQEHQLRTLANHRLHLGSPNKGVAVSSPNIHQFPQAPMQGAYENNML